MIEYGKNFLPKVCSGQTRDRPIHGRKGRSKGVLLSVWGVVNAVQDTDLNLPRLFADEDPAVDEG